jgi:hypothetical protein
MHIVDEPMETVHLYVMREEPKRPYTVLPLLAACACLVMIAAMAVYSGEHPAYQHQTLTIPAQLLPLQTFTTSQAIIPTGTKTYPATAAHGTLTITNGSVIAQTLPAGFIFISNSGVSVATDQAVFVPAGTANEYGYAVVSAHATIAGTSGNIPALAVDTVIGSSVYVRNLTAFQGGEDAYSVKFATAQDKQIALATARQHLARLSTGLHYPCLETMRGSFVVTWRCQFLTYHLPAYMHVTGVKINGRNLLVAVWFVARPVHSWVK